MRRHRLGKAVVVIVAMTMSSAIAAPRIVRLQVQQDGSVYLGDTRYWTDAKLQAALDALAKERPAPEVHVTGGKTLRFESLGKVLMMMQKAGIPAKIGFITGPNQ